jgi:glycyl-tRNA synthetase alpha subunit
LAQFWSKCNDAAIFHWSKVLDNQNDAILHCSHNQFHEEAQNGMSCKEVIQFIMKLTSTTKKTCENHFDWMIKNKHLPELKNFGQVKKAQAVTTKCACIRAMQ